MATWQARVSEFITDQAPDSEQAVEVLCEDHNGTYVLPFLCRMQSGAWVNANTGGAVDATVAGWRIPKQWGTPRRR